MSKLYKIQPVLIPLLMLIWAVLMIRIDAPWYGIQEAPRTWIPAAVRNYDIYGIETTGLMVIRNAAPADPADFSYYSHHPPLIIWLPALATTIFGDHELSIRFPFIVVTLLGAVILYVFVRRLYHDSQIAWWSAAFYGLTPMLAYYGRVPGYAQFSMLIGLTFGIVLYDWLRRPTRIRLWALIALTVLSVWTAWTAIAFVAAFAVAAFLIGTWRQKAVMVGLGVVSVIAFALLMGFYQLQWDGSIDSILNAFVYRSSTAANDEQTRSFTAPEFIAVTLAHTAVLGTIGMLVLSLIGVIPAVRHGRRLQNGMLFGMFLGTAGYQIVFLNASFVHDYYKITQAPIMGTLAAFAVMAGWRSEYRRWTRPLVAALLVVTVVHSTVVMFVWHGSGNRPWITAVVTSIQETEDDSLLVTHLRGKDYIMPVEFYARRDVEEGVSYVEAESLAMETGQQVIYIECPEMMEAEFMPMPEEHYPFSPADECRVYTIMP